MKMSLLLLVLIWANGYQAGKEIENKKYGQAGFYISLAITLITLLILKLVKTL